MIKGIGIDIIELDRIASNMKNYRFIERILTSNEIASWKRLEQEKRKVEYLAGRFAAKEALAKATGTGIGKLSFQDIEILNNSYGAPEMKVKDYDHYQIFVSISHSRSHAIAQVVIASNK